MTVHSTQGTSATAPVRAPAYLVFLLAGLVFNMFSGHSQDLGLPIGPDRLCFAAAVPLLLLDGRPWRGVRLHLRGVHVVMALLVLLATLSAITVGTLTTTLGFYALLDRLILPFLLFTAAPVVFLERGHRDLLLKVLISMGLYLGAMAFCQRIGPQALVWPRYIVDPSVGLQFDRARGPFTESVAMGVALAFCGFSAAAGAYRLDHAWRWISRLTALLCTLGVLLTLTRSIWLGTIAGLVAALAADTRTRRLLLPVAGAGVTLVLLTFLVVPGLTSSASSRAESQLPVWDRKNTDVAALRIGHEHPLTGVGWLRFIDVGVEYVRQADSYPITATRLEVHNVVLGRLAELGVPGVALFLLTLAGGPLAAILRRADDDEDRAWRFILIGGGTCWLSAVMLSPLGQPLPNFLVWLLSGVLLRHRFLERADTDAPGRVVTG